PPAPNALAGRVICAQDPLNPKGTSVAGRTRKDIQRGIFATRSLQYRATAVKAPSTKAFAKDIPHEALCGQFEPGACGSCRPIPQHFAWQGRCPAFCRPGNLLRDPGK